MKAKSFWGQPTKFKKESFRTRLKPFGDADLDGTPNKFDCSPKNASKDGLFGRLIHAVTGGRAGQSKSEYQAEKVAKLEERIRSRFKKRREREDRRYAGLEERKLRTTSAAKRRILSARQSGISEEKERRLEALRRFKRQLQGELE